MFYTKKTLNHTTYLDTSHDVFMIVSSNEPPEYLTTCPTPEDAANLADSLTQCAQHQGLSALKRMFTSLEIHVATLTIHRAFEYAALTS